MDPWATIKITVAEIRIALSAENLYFAAKELGHEPSALEAVHHYLKHQQVPPRIAEFDVSGEPTFI